MFKYDKKTYYDNSKGSLIEKLKEVYFAANSFFFKKKKPCLMLHGYKELLRKGNTKKRSIFHLLIHFPDGSK